MRGYPHFSFQISIELVKIYVSCIITHRGKKYLLLVGTVLNGIPSVPFLRWVLANLFDHPVISASGVVACDASCSTVTKYDDCY